MIPPVLVTPPAATPVSLVEAKAQARVSSADEDTLIEALIDAATAHLDGWSGTLGRCLVSQRWRVDLWRWGVARLPFPDARNVSITYRDALDVEQTVVTADHRLDMDARGPLLVFRSGWTSPALLTGAAASVSVEFDTGYGEPADVPAALRQAILIHVEAMYDRLEDGSWRLAYNSLVAPYRVVRV